MEFYPSLSPARNLELQFSSQFRLPGAGSGVQAAAGHSPSNKTIIRLLNSAISKQNPFNKKHFVSDKDDASVHDRMLREDARYTHHDTLDALDAPHPNRKSCHFGDPFSKLSFSTTFGSQNSADEPYSNKTSNSSSLRHKAPGSRQFPPPPYRRSAASLVNICEGHSPSLQHTDRLPTTSPCKPPECHHSSAHDPGQASILGHVPITADTGPEFHFSVPPSSDCEGNAGGLRDATSPPTLHSVENKGWRRLRWRRGFRAAVVNQFRKIRSLGHFNNGHRVNTRPGQSSKGRGARKGSTRGTIQKTTSSAHGGAKTPSRKRPRLNKGKANEGTDGEEEEEEDGDDDDEPDGDQVSEVQVHGRFLACPYFKRCPRRYSRCSQRRFDTAPHMLQHLLRSHVVFTCPLCNSTFDTSRLFSRHFSIQPCEEHHLEDAGERIGEEMGTRLKARQKKRNIPESDRWFQIWDIIFENHERPSLAWIDDPAAAILRTCIKDLALINPSDIPQDLHKELNNINSRPHLERIFLLTAEAFENDSARQRFPLTDGAEARSDIAQASVSHAQSHATVGNESLHTSEVEVHPEGTNEHTGQEVPVTLSQDEQVLSATVNPNELHSFLEDHEWLLDYQSYHVPGSHDASDPPA